MSTYSHIETILTNAMDENVVSESIFMDVSTENDKLESIRGNRRVFIEGKEKGNQTPKDDYWNAGIFRPMTYRDLARVIALLPDDSYWNLSTIEMNAVRLFYNLSQSLLSQHAPNGDFGFLSADPDKDNLLNHCKNYAEDERFISEIENSGAFGLDIKTRPVACFGLALAHGKIESGVYLRFTGLGLLPVDIGRYDPEYATMTKLTTIANDLLEENTHETEDEGEDIADVAISVMESALSRHLRRADTPPICPAPC